MTTETPAITDPVEAEVVQLIRSAQGNVTQAVQLLVGSNRLYKQMLLRYQELEVAIKSHTLDGQFLNVQVALNKLEEFRNEITTRANQSSVNNSPADSPGA